MNNRPGEEDPTEFLEPVDEDIGHNVVEGETVHEEIVEGEEVLEEEIVHAEDMMYTEGGELFQNVVLYEDGTEVIEEYLEVEDYGGGRIAYRCRDGDGKEHLVTAEEGFEKDDDGQGPSSSQAYVNPRTRYITKPAGKHPRMYMERAGYLPHHYQHQHHQPPQQKRLTEMAKVDVESYVPKQTINRRPLPDGADFKPKHTHRSRKNPPWQDEDRAVNRDAAVVRSLSPVSKDPLFPEDDEMLVRFKCPECPDGFSTMERHCEHMQKNHDCQAVIRETDFFQDRDFEIFLAKKDSKESNALRTKKSRAGASQMFVCNYMNKSRQKGPEFVEVSLTSMAERPQEVCTAFVQKLHSYECIRVKYCDTHVHHDGTIGYRVPLTVKRRLFELAFKRIPIPCMQVILEAEIEHLLPHRTRFEDKLRNLTHHEIIELLNIINSSLKKQHGPEQQRITNGKKVAIKYDYITTAEGHSTVVVRRVNDPSAKDRFDASDMNHSSHHDGGMYPEMMSSRGDNGSLEDDENPELVEGCEGIILDSMLYDPPNGRDPRFGELTEQELLVLEAYERDIGVQLSDEQKKDRIRQKVKYSLEKVNALYQSVDAATHGVIPVEMHLESIKMLREMSSFVVELSCQLAAEVKAQFNPSSSVEAIKTDIITGISMQERVSHPERRRRSAPSQHNSPHKPYRGQPPPPPPPHRSHHQEYAERVYAAQQRKAAQQPPHVLTMRPPFEHHMEPEEEPGQQQSIQMLREQHHHQHQQQLQQQQQQRHLQQHQQVHPEDDLQPVDDVEEEQKPTVIALPEEFKAVPWTKPTRRRGATASDGNPAPRKRGRPAKKMTPPIASEVIPAAQPETEQIVEEETVVDLNAPLHASEAQESTEKVGETVVETGQMEKEKEAEDQKTKQNVEENAIAEKEKTSEIVEEAIVKSTAPETSSSSSSPSPPPPPTTATESTSTAAPPAVTSSSSTTSTTSSTTSSTFTPAATKTRTGRVVKPKKWNDE